MHSDFLQNYLAIRFCFPSEYSKYHALGAFLCLMEDSGPTGVLGTKEILESKQILKQHLGISTAFRDYLRVPLVVHMALADDPEAYLQKFVEIYQAIHPTYFTGSGQRFITTMALYGHCQKDEIEETTTVAYEIYHSMRKQHPVLTGQEDMVFAALIAMSRKSLEEILTDMDEHYAFLKKNHFLPKNELQNISHILAMTHRSAEQSTERFMELYQELKQVGAPLENGPQLLTASILSVLDEPLPEIARKVRQTDTELLKQKKYGKLRVKASHRMMLAHAITAAEYLEEYNNQHPEIETDMLKTTLSCVVTGGILLTDNTMKMSKHQ